MTKYKENGYSCQGVIDWVSEVKSGPKKCISSYQMQLYFFSISRYLIIEIYEKGKKGVKYYILSPIKILFFIINMVNESFNYKKISDLGV